VHFQGESLRHHRAAVVEEARHAHDPTARISAASAATAATLTDFTLVPSPSGCNGDRGLAVTGQSDGKVVVVGTQENSNTGSPTPLIVQN